MGLTLNFYRWINIQSTQSDITSPAGAQWCEYDLGVKSNLGGCPLTSC